VPDTQKPCKLSAVKITHLEAKRLKMNDFIKRYASSNGLRVSNRSFSNLCIKRAMRRCALEEVIKVQLIKKPALFYTEQAFKLLKAIKTLRLR